MIITKTIDKLQLDTVAHYIYKLVDVLRGMHMAFKKQDITAPVSRTEIEFFEQWSAKLTKVQFKLFHDKVCPIIEIRKAKSGKGFTLVVLNTCLIWVWSNSKFGESIKAYLASPIGKPCVQFQLDKEVKSFDYGIDDEAICELMQIDETTWCINQKSPKLP